MADNFGKMADYTPKNILITGGLANWDFALRERIA